MSRKHRDIEDVRRRVARALIVGAYTDVDWDAYIRRETGWTDDE